jgi:hypothetical protein
LKVSNPFLVDERVDRHHPQPMPARLAERGLLQVRPHGVAGSEVSGQDLFARNDSLNCVW